MVEVTFNGETYQLRGRAAMIVAYLALTQQRLLKPDKVSLSFDCAGKAVSVEWKERHRLNEPHVLDASRR